MPPRCNSTATLVRRLTPPNITRGSPGPSTPTTTCHKRKRSSSDLASNKKVPTWDGDPDPGPGLNPVVVVDPSRLCLCLPVFDFSETVDSPVRAKVKLILAK